MSRRVAKWLAWSMITIAVVLAIGVLPLVVAVTRAAAAPHTPLPLSVAAPLQARPLGWLELPLRLAVACALAVLGALLVSRDPAHGLGWIFCVIGVDGSLEIFTEIYAVDTLFVAPGKLPGGLVAAWIQ